MYLDNNKMDTQMAKTLDPSDYIVPLNMNGMQGRMLKMPAPNNTKREILMIYGHHSSIERWFGLIEVLNKYGSITVPDLPGFGGMDSFYKIGHKPTMDEMADYVAAFIKVRYKRRKITLVGMSYGFVILTRMLQRYPDMVKQVDLMVSIVGFAHKDDFLFTKPRYWGYRITSTVFSLPVLSSFFREVALNPFILRTFYSKTHNAKNKFKDVADKELKNLIDMEVWLWRNNEARTYMYSSREMLTLNNCKKMVNLPVYHVYAKNDHFFNNTLVEQHLRIIFTDYTGMSVSMSKHAPTVIADAKAAAPFVPHRLRKILAKQP